MIVAIRELIYGALASGDPPVPVYRWLPLSPEEVPCYVVGRPTLREGVRVALADLSVPVFVLGRTTRDDDAQTELDELTDLLVGRLWSPWAAEGVSLKLTTVEPSTVEVAGTIYPAYTATVSAECRPNC